MGIGTGIVLIILGLILLYALEVDIPGVGDDALGWILVLGGLAVTLISIAMMASRRRATAVTRTTDSAGRAQVSETSVEGNDPYNRPL